MLVSFYRRGSGLAAPPLLLLTHTHPVSSGAQCPEQGAWRGRKQGRFCLLQASEASSWGVAASLPRILLWLPHREAAALAAHFTDEETEARVDWVACLRAHGGDSEIPEGQGSASSPPASPASSWGASRPEATLQRGERRDSHAARVSSPGGLWAAAVGSPAPAAELAGRVVGGPGAIPAAGPLSVFQPSW